MPSLLTPASCAEIYGCRRNRTSPMVSLRSLRNLIILICFLVLCVRFARVWDDILLITEDTDNFGNTEDFNFYNRESRDSTDTPGLSACLLVKDENDRLPEWIAYHLTTAPLKFLIVAVDPLSKVEPTDILKGFNGTDGLVIWQWFDGDYMPPRIFKKAKEQFRLYKRGIYEPDDKPQAHTFHVMRQNHFVSACLLRMKLMGKRWVFHIDADEFLTFNSIDREQDPYPPLSGANYVEQAVSGSIRKEEWEETAELLRNGVSQYKGGTVPGVSGRSKEIMRVREQVPKVGRETIEKFILKHKKRPPFSDRRGFMLPRLYFSGLRSDPDIISANVPKEFDPKNLFTMKYLIHANRGWFEHNGHGKTLMDISQFKIGTFPLFGIAVKNVHNLMMQDRARTMYETLYSDEDILPFNDALFRVHHYSGSWESFSFKSDGRRTKEDYKKKNDILDPLLSDDMRPWLQAFVNKVGIRVAQELLRDTGKVEGSVG
eukprot:CAMPEP_0194282560 /NCGR_PEP_ID=MMETSP0169-20130528/23396_1 /TAXON_ID=218684 /ORGANISM="Corethron pennatum, Strain L29A3" /LENGTH=486 /DNA_ID=CAMNT_0039027921 /DNA_START=14 /DNA_END=1474 /DNA_ORIENTATION=-